MVTYAKTKSWEEITNIYSEYFEKGRNGKKNKENFKTWMLAQKDYSPSSYKEGMFADFNLYRHCFAIHNKINNTEQHHVTVWTGKVGKGKSTGAIQMCSLISPSFCMKDICYTPEHFFRRIVELKRGDSILIDEGGRFFGSKMHMTKLARHLQETFDIIRGFGLHICICFPKYHKLDPTIREELIDSLFLKVINNKGKTPKEKYRYYIGFNNTAIISINEQIKKKRIVLSQVKVSNGSRWRGHHSAEFPNINGITPETYKQNKRTYSKDRMLDLADEYKEQGDTKREEVDLKKKNIKLIKTKKAAELLGVTPATVVTYIKTNKITGTRRGVQYFVDEQSVQDYIKNSLVCVN